MRQLAWLAVVAGCSFDHGAIPGSNGDGGVIDGNGSGSDGEMITADARTCWEVAGVNVNVCLNAPPTGTTTVSSNTSIDTDSSGTGVLQCKNLVQGSTNVCVIAADSLTIDNARTLTAHGDRPLVLLANQLVIDGIVDVSSTLGGQRGAASDPQVCGVANAAAGPGGGAGGSFGGKGGDGGNNDNDGNGADAANPTANIATLRGGCPGSGGGDNGPYGGHGGGAVLLIADKLTISSGGVINASGSAGNGATQGRRGGDGGSSGGMIAISATTIALDPGGRVFANGGHGGGGSTDTTAGTDGTEPDSPMSGGAGGNGAAQAGDGGPGFSAPMRNGKNAPNSNDGGGGGGGGAGVIRIYTQSVPMGPNVSPQANS